MPAPSTATLRTPLFMALNVMEPTCATAAPAAGWAGSAGFDQEHRDQTVGLGLVLGVRRVGVDRALPPDLPFLALEFTGVTVDHLVAVLDGDGIRVGLQV